MMKITVKTLNKGAGGKADSFDVDISPEDTILQVKQKVETERPDYEAQGQKLICAGRILQNEKTVTESNLKEGDFLVVIPGKKTTSSPPPEAANTTTTTATTSTDGAQPAPAQPPAEDSRPAPGVAAAPVSNSREAEAAITQLTEMGFPRDQCEAALRAAYGNPDRAVEYLMNGIPPQEEDTPMPPAAGGGPPAGAAAPGGGASAPAPGGGVAPSGAEGFTGMAFPQLGAGGGAQAGAEGGPGAEGGDPMGGMDLGALQQALQQNPAMLQQVLGQLGQTHPELLQMFQQNPEALMQVLAGQMGGGGGLPGGMGGMPGGMGGGAPAAGGEGQIQVNLSPEDQAAVGRLEQLGFPRAAVVQAYLAAEKNEELAANLLFDMGDDL